MALDDFKPFAPRVVLRPADNANGDDRQNTTQEAAPSAPDPDRIEASAFYAAQVVTGLPETSNAFDETLERNDSMCTPRCIAHLRATAIKIAGIACARALHQAIAHNPLFVARFVDDALAAIGHPARALVRLSPSDAVAIDGHVRGEIIADPTMISGEIVVESGSSRIGATIERRASILAAWAYEAEGADENPASRVGATHSDD